MKADDIGVALARERGAIAGRAAVRAFGRGLVRGMPGFLRVLALVGTAAMIWVGGGIVRARAREYGFDWLGHAIHDAAEAAAPPSRSRAGAVGWLVGAAGFGLVGLALGLALIPVVGLCLRADRARPVGPARVRRAPPSWSARVARSTTTDRMTRCQRRAIVEACKV